jgi:hypothetical protein
MTAALFRREVIMDRPSSRSHILRTWFDDLVEQLADGVKEAMLDLDFDNDRPEFPAPPEDLPPADREELIAALRDRTEATLRAATILINEVQPGPGWQDGQQRLAELFVELAREAFAMGLRLRTEAALHQPVERPPIIGLWAERYRRMRLMEAAFPEVDGPDDD